MITLYKGNREEDEEESPRKIRKTGKDQKKTGKGAKKGEEKYQKKEKEITSVLFVPHKTGSNLAKEIRKKEEQLKDIT